MLLPFFHNESHNVAKLLREIDRLKAEVERLRREKLELNAELHLYRELLPKYMPGQRDVEEF